MDESQKKIRGYASILGGLFLQIMCGAVYIWGSISPYICSYLKDYDSSARPSVMFVVFPFMFFSLNLSISLGMKFAAIIGLRLMSFICSVIMSLSVFSTSYVKSLPLFMFTYPIVCGLCAGILNVAPIANGWKYFPEKRGIVSGLILMGGGLGSLIFNIISAAIVNPDNKTATIPDLVSGRKNVYFAADVANNVPSLFRILALLFFVFGCIGSFLSIEPSSVSFFSWKKVEANKEINKEVQRKAAATRDPSQEQAPYQKQVDEEELEETKKELEDEKLQTEYFNDGLEKPHVSEENLLKVQTLNNKKKFISFYPSEKKETEFAKASDENHLHFKSDNLADRKKRKKKTSLRKGFKAHLAMESLHFGKKIIMKKNVVSCKTIKQGLTSSQFWILFFMIVFSSFYGFFQSGASKFFGLRKGHGDSFLTLSASLGAVANSIARVFWAIAYDRYGFKATYTAMCLIQIIGDLVMRSFSNYSGLFISWMIFGVFCFGGHFPVFSVACAEVFGIMVGPNIWGTLFFGFSTANFLAFGMNSLLVPSIGYDYVFLIGMGMTIVSLLCMFLLNMRPNWPEVIEKLDIVIKEVPVNSPEIRSENKHNENPDGLKHKDVSESKEKKRVTFQPPRKGSA